MKSLTLVTGNKNKLREFEEILNTPLSSFDFDLPEIQSPSVEVVALTKAKEAYTILKKPVIVEDTGFELDAWKGLPGAFLKFFEQAFYKDHLIKLLAGETNRKGAAVCAIGYCDRNISFTVLGKVHGSITEEPRGECGFGFDYSFVPDGYTKTFAEMTSEEKNKISHRKRAIESLQKELIARTLSGYDKT